MSKTLKDPKLLAAIRFTEKKISILVSHRCRLGCSGGRGRRGRAGGRRDECFQLGGRAARGPSSVPTDTNYLFIGDLRCAEDCV
jgi:hypothetical protein